MIDVREDNMVKNIKDIKIALISPRAVASKNMIRRVQPPLGLCCIAAGLRQEGYKNILIYDTLIEDYDDVRKLDSGNYYSVGRTIPTSSSNKGINRGYGPGTRHLFV